jgi:small subunit ribosomal protein S6e
MSLKLVIGDPKTGTTYQEEIDETGSLMGKAIGDTVDGGPLGFPGYTFKITGGSDQAGFPMRKDAEGTGRHRVLTTRGVGFREKDTSKRVRKTVAGNTIYDETAQVNVRVEAHGSTPLGDEPTEEASDETAEATASDEDAASEDGSDEAGGASGSDDDDTDDQTEEPAEEPSDEDDEATDDTEEADEEDEVPDDSWTVDEIKTWLDDNDVDYTSDDLKDDLLEKAQNA